MLVHLLIQPSHLYICTYPQARVFTQVTPARLRPLTHTRSHLHSATTTDKVPFSVAGRDVVAQHHVDGGRQRPGAIDKEKGCHEGEQVGGQGVDGPEVDPCTDNLRVHRAKTARHSCVGYLQRPMLYSDDLTDLITQMNQAATPRKCWSRTKS